MNLIEEHPRMTIQSVIASVKSMTDSSTYDDYNKDNMRDALMYLLNSIDATVKQEITPFITSSTTGTELWMRIVGTVQSSTIERLSKLSKTIRNIKLSDYKENVKEYSRVMMGYSKELDSAHKLPEEICYIILDHLCESSNEKFKVDFMGMRKKIAQEIREYHGKSRDAIKNIQVTNGHYTYISLLEEACETYQTLVDLGQWSVVGKSRDKGGVPEAMTAEVNALVQQLKASFKRNWGKDDKGSSKQSDTRRTDNRNKSKRIVKCYTCGEEGHIKPNCPNPRNPSGNLAGGGNATAGGSGARSWKVKPPRSGEPRTKTVDGTEWHWCGRCGGGNGRWSATHGTAEHNTNGQPSGGATTAANPQGNVHEAVMDS